MLKNLVNYSARIVRKSIWIGAAICACSINSAAAINLFAPKLKINDAIVTEFEYAQRQSFLKLLNAPGDLQELALGQLTDESLQKQAADKLGVSLDQAALKAGMEEFAGRFQLEVPAFVSVLQQNGVAAESFRDFVSAGILWRNVVQTRFRGAIEINEDEINQEISRLTNPPNIRVLLSEIVLVPQSADQLEEARQFATQFKSIKSTADFSELARQYSSAVSRDQGGKLKWLSLSNLPPVIQDVVLSLRTGEVSDPLILGNGVTVLQLRGLRELETPASRDQKLDYAVVSATGINHEEGENPLVTLAKDARRCDDLYGLTQSLGENVVKRETRKLSNISKELVLSLAQMDPGENVILSEGSTSQRLLMLCERSAELPKDVTREQVSARLQNKKIDSYAAAYLEELRAQAHITEF